MKILTIRTDKPEAEIGLYDDSRQVVYEVWEAHRQLAETLNRKITTILDSQSLDLENIEGIVCFKGPGSFTGLRIGLSVGNALASSLGIPIVAEQGSEWAATGLKRLLKGETDIQATPFYGAPIYITPQKH